MKKCIGLICEGPTDRIVLRTIINHISQEENDFRLIQPEPDCLGRYGNGWKGVWKWCEKNKKIIPHLLNDIVPCIDALVIHMDGDVSRKEKEAHCCCDKVPCELRNTSSPIDCIKISKGECPVVLPCPAHPNTPNGNRIYLEGMIRQLSETENEKTRIITMIPCDSTEAWVVSAFNDSEYPEKINDPWNNIISRSKEYHGIRIRGKKKSSKLYEKFVPVLQDNWNRVVKQCESAADFDGQIRRLFFGKL